MIALTRLPAPTMDRCELTYLERNSIDVERARAEHRTYCEALTECGAEVRVLDAEPDYPDSTFLEDVAVVLDEIAILCSMGTESRREEPGLIEDELRQYRELERIERPARLEGGDVLHVGRTLFVGESSRTDSSGIEGLRSIASRLDYRVVPVPVHGCLHLKTACTALPDGRLLVNPEWVEVSALEGRPALPVPRDEPWGANVLSVGEETIVAAANPQTAALISDLGFAVRLVGLAEFAKAEAGPTCLSLVFEG